MALRPDAANFERFLEESKHSLTSALGLHDKDLSNATFIASPAMSGTNAFSIAKQIALTMKTQSGFKPTIKQYAPCYYELHTPGFKGSDVPDIFVFSTGPIVNQEGLSPGVDINFFVQEKVIKTGRKIPTTLIVDATTTLYKNLRLNDEVKNLVREGKLSIIVFESHQKFGLLHSDQAQYGRVFCLCGSKMHDAEKLQQIQSNAQSDFDQHLDMRVGAYINYCCQDILEQIKQQHFNNGALFRNILNQANLIFKNIYQHEYMAKNLDELYFVLPRSLLSRLIPYRQSFAHYSTTLAKVGEFARLSANASDDIDILLTSARIYLFMAANGIEKMIYESSRAIGELSESEKIINLAMALTEIEKPSAGGATQLKLYCALNNILNACQSLRGRDAYEEVARYFYKLQKQIIIPENPDFIYAIQIVYNQNIHRFQSLKENPALCKFLVTVNQWAPPIQLNKDLIDELIQSQELLENILQHKDFFKNSDLFKNNPHLKISLNANALSSLVTMTDEKKIQCLSRLGKEGIEVDYAILKLIAESHVVDFIENTELISKEFISTLSILHEAGINLDDETMKLAKDNEQFRQLLSMVYITNQRILKHLKEKEGGDKYQESLNYTPTYLKACFLAIKLYAAQPTPEPEKLIKSISRANNDYSKEVLSKFRTNLGKVISIILNGLKAGIDKILNRNSVEESHRQRFFKTASEKILNTVETQLSALNSRTKK